MNREQSRDIFFLTLALEEARKAKFHSDVPVGALIVQGTKVIAKAHNEKEVTGDVTAHAELLVIRRAVQISGDWRLTAMTLYSTLEPCPMCAGAIIQARLGRLVYGAKDPKAGACGSVVNLLQASLFNHETALSYQKHDGCSRELSAFFKTLRRVTLQSTH